MNRIKVATVFSGIGAVEFALKRLGIPHDIIFACDNGDINIDYNLEEELTVIKSLSGFKEKKEYVDMLYKSKTKRTNFVKQSFLSNYDCDESKFYEDIRLLDGLDFTEKVDLLVGGSPCQSFSSVGNKGGLEDARGTLFYDFARLVKETKPKVFIYENVRNIINHDKGNTWKTIKSVFDSLGYHYKYEILNASDYGIPQNRRRLFVVGTKNEANFDMPPEKKPLKFTMQDFLIDNCQYEFFTHKKNGDIKVNPIHGEVKDKYTLTPLLYKYVMSTGTKGFYQKPEINRPIARTILKTMGNRHRAGIDNYISKGDSQNLGDVRMLTEREALRLMGFTDEFNIVVSRAQAYMQAGNSIVVDVLIAILKELIIKNIISVSEE